MTPPPATGTPIVHLGLGAFARAHLATYADDLLAAGHDARITAVSLRTATVVDALRARGHRYAVVVRDGRGGEHVREVRSIVAVATGPAAAVAAVADPACRLVTLTVTEAGYGVVPGSTGPTAVLGRGRADVAADLDLLRGADRVERLDGAGLATVVGVLVVGLARRRAAGHDAPIVASLDNVAANGATLRAAVVELASEIDGSLAGWIEAHAAFPSSVVDRIVPATPPDLSEHLASGHGIADAVPILTEPHRSWALEVVPGDRHLPWPEVGVEVVADVTAHERRKLWLLNGPHSAAAIVGLARGHDTIADAVADPEVRSIVQAVADDAIEVADLPSALDGPGFVAEVLDRFANPVLGHRCAQVATDSELKLPLRIVPVLERRLARGLPAGVGAQVVATFLAVDPGPAAARLRSALPPSVARVVEDAGPVA